MILGRIFQLHPELNQQDLYPDVETGDPNTDVSTCTLRMRPSMVTIPVAMLTDTKKVDIGAEQMSHEIRRSLIDHPGERIIAGTLRLLVTVEHHAGELKFAYIYAVKGVK